MIPVERLRVAERAHHLALAVYRATDGWTDRSLAIQARRAALSVPANVAEGASREGPREFARFIGIAFASAAELAYHLRFAEDLGILATERATALREETALVRRMLWALLQRLRVASRRQGASAQPTGRSAANTREP